MIYCVRSYLLSNGRKEAWNRDLNSQTQEQLREMLRVRLSCRDGRPIAEVVTWLPCLRVTKGILGHLFPLTLKHFWELPFLPNGWKFTGSGIICTHIWAKTLKTSCSHSPCLGKQRSMINPKFQQLRKSPRWWEMCRTGIVLKKHSPTLVQWWSRLTFLYTAPCNF